MSAVAACGLWLNCLIGMALFGGALFRLCLPEQPAVAAIDPPLRRIFRWLAGAALAAAIAQSGIEAAALGGSWALAADPDTLNALLADTAFGHAWLWHGGAALLLCGAVAGRRPFARVALLAAALLATQALTGHAAMAEGLSGLYWRGNHAVHLLAGGAWLGGMIPLALLARSPACPTELFHRFTPYGIGAVCLVILSGTYNAGQLAEASPALFTDPYGQTLLVKLAMVVLMGGCGLANRLWCLPGAAGGSPPPGALRIGLLLEMLLGALTVGVACWLGSLPPMTGGG